MIFILLNILIFIILISVWYNPNGNFTDLQFFTLFVAFFGTLFFLKDSQHESSLSIFLSSLCLSSNSLLFSFVSKSGFTERENKSFLVIYDKSNFIDKKEQELILPFHEYNFSKVTLNPKFIAKYYDLQDRKRSFTEFITFTFLGEYFYFKSLKSFYLSRKEVPKS